MKVTEYITYFNTYEEYAAFVQSEDFARPNVSLCEENDTLYYNGESAPAMYRWVESGTTCDGYDKYAVEIEQVSLDGGITWNNTDPLVERRTLIEHNSPDCGYVDPMYQWADYGTECENFNLFKTEVYQVSTDGGQTWENVEPLETRRGELIEENSYACGYVPSRWVEDGTMCDGYNKYVKEKKQISNDSGETWVDVDPEETRKGDLIELNSTDCGYVPPMATYQWVEDGFTCDENYSKYVQEKRQVSFDGGETWADVEPLETRVGALIEENSVDCGYVPPIEPIYKWEEDGEILDQGNRYVKERKYVSYDNGETWEYTGITRNGALLEESAYTEDYSSDYLTMRIISGGTIQMVDTDPGDPEQDPRAWNSWATGYDGEYDMFGHADHVWYSRDNGETWNEYEIHTIKEDIDCEILTVEAGEKILWKGESDYGLGYSFYYPNCPTYDVEGNIMSLIWGDDFANKTSLKGSTWTFADLFSTNNVVHADKLILPARTLTFGCYEGMFFDCRSLLTAPELPATNTAKYCYYYMFDQAMALVTAPELPADDTSIGCYQDMFFNCRSLVNGPSAIYASHLAEESCETMFGRCYNLIAAPDMSAVETVDKNACIGMFLDCKAMTTGPSVLNPQIVTEGAYHTMFSGCTNLVVAPIIMAESVDAGGCTLMFSNCSKLNYVESHIQAYGSSYTDRWLEGVAAQGTFIKNPLVPSTIRGTWIIPEGWTVQDYTT